LVISQSNKLDRENPKAPKPDAKARAKPLQELARVGRVKASNEYQNPVMKEISPNPGVIRSG
jgi:hypothetical protein